METKQTEGVTRACQEFIKVCKEQIRKIEEKYPEFADDYSDGQGLDRKGDY